MIRIEGELGKSGQGSVFKCSINNKSYAIKLFDQEDVGSFEQKFSTQLTIINSLRMNGADEIGKLDRLIKVIGVTIQSTKHPDTENKIENKFGLIFDQVEDCSLKDLLVPNKFEDLQFAHHML